MSFPHSRIDCLAKAALSFAVALLGLFWVPTPAQSSLFNIPTAEVMPERSVYIEADFDAKFAPRREGGWQSYGISTIYGIHKKTEVGMNVFMTRTADGIAPVEIQPNVKYRVFSSEDLGVSLSAGAIAYMPISKRSQADTSATVYLVGSKQFAQKWAPKVSGGVYQNIAADRDSGSTRGLLAAIEQPLHSRVSLIVDWRSGTGRFGYSAAGVGVAVTTNSYLSSAYYFGNEGRGNNSLGIYYGITF
jgi:hypothetical protein